MDSDDTSNVIDSITPINIEDITYLGTDIGPTRNSVASVKNIG